MKRLILTLLVLFTILAAGQAQDKLKIGELKNGKLVITNPLALQAYFLKSLGNNGSLGKEYQVSTSLEGDRCLIYYPVLGNSDKVSSIGVMLVKVKNEFVISPNPPGTEAAGPGIGGSLEIQCIGDNCSACLPNIKWINGQWMPLVYCECISPGGGKCNMTSKLVIKGDL